MSQLIIALQVKPNDELEKKKYKSSNSPISNGTQKSKAPSYGTQKIATACYCYRATVYMYLITPSHTRLVNNITEQPGS